MSTVEQMSRIKRRTTHTLQRKRRRRRKDGRVMMRGKKNNPNNHDLHRTEKAVPASTEEMTRRCFLVNCFSELRKLNCLPATENRKSAGLR